MRCSSSLSTATPYSWARQRLPFSEPSLERAPTCRSQVVPVDAGDPGRPPRRVCRQGLRRTTARISERPRTACAGSPSGPRPRTSKRKSPCSGSAVRTTRRISAGVRGPTSRRCVRLRWSRTSAGPDLVTPTSCRPGARPVLLTGPWRKPVRRFRRAGSAASAGNRQPDRPRSLIGAGTGRSAVSLTT